MLLQAVCAYLRHLAIATLLLAANSSVAASLIEHHGHHTVLLFLLPSLDNSHWLALLACCAC
jgi:hypothetical protein